jgi:hypothetical protein
MLDALGNIGDFVGGVAVVVTLLYLAAQIRHNTRSTKTQSWQAAVAAVSEWSREIGRDPESTRILQSGSADFDALSDLERAQFNLLMNSFLRNCENIHYQFINGSIDGSTWSGWAQRTLSILDAPGARAWWATTSAAYSPEFQRFVRETAPAGPVPESFIKQSQPHRGRTESEAPPWSEQR